MNARATVVLATLVALAACLQPSPPISELPPGQTAVIDEVDTSTTIGRRLQDLGFVSRTPVTVVRQAPLGDPVVYELRGTQLCLRRSEAKLVQVRPE